MTWLGDEANTRSTVKGQPSFALWNVIVVQTNCEPVRPNHSASDLIIVHGPRRTPSWGHLCHILRQKALCWQQRLSHLQFISKYSQIHQRSHIANFKIWWWHPSKSSQPAWGSVIGSRRCLTGQLYHKPSTCFWLDEQHTSLCACSTGLELDR